jgi:hypothetical protein
MPFDFDLLDDLGLMLALSLAHGPHPYSGSVCRDPGPKLEAGAVPCELPIVWRKVVGLNGLLCVASASGPLFGGPGVRRHMGVESR